MSDTLEETRNLRKQLAEASTALSVLQSRIDARKPLVDAIMHLLTIYLPSAAPKLSMQVGANTTATVSFAGPVNQEVIADLITQLDFHKKYFPKDIQALDPIAQLRTLLDDKFSEIEAQESPLP